MHGASAGTESRNLTPHSVLGNSQVGTLLRCAATASATRTRRAARRSAPRAAARTPFRGGALHLLAFFLAHAHALRLKLLAQRFHSLERLLLFAQVLIE